MRANTRLDAHGLTIKRLERAWKPKEPKPALRPMPFMPRLVKDKDFVVEVLSWCIVVSLFLAAFYVVIRPTTPRMNVTPHAASGR